jgi:thiamine-phosphate pyrophosphorylase
MEVISKLSAWQAGLYPVITREFCRNGSSLETLKQVLQAGARMVQLREKDPEKDGILKMAALFREWTSQYGAWLIINDHIDIALACGADGVHLGQNDIPCRVAKRIAPALIVGISTHSLEEVLAAENDGADYINIGPVFKTNTKAATIAPLGIGKAIEISRNIHIPFTVMGGIKEENLESLVSAGASRIAMITEITMSRDVRNKFKRMSEKLRSAWELRKGDI